MKTLIANETIPFKPTHPGEILKDELIARGITQKRFATILGMPYTALNEVLNAKRPINTELALLIEAVLGLDPEALVNMQTRYNMQMTRKDVTFRQRLESVRKICASML